MCPLGPILPPFATSVGSPREIHMTAQLRRAGVHIAEHCVLMALATRHHPAA